MEDWLVDETLRFTPLSGSFDTEALGTKVAALGFTFRDKADPTTYVIAATKAGRDSFHADRLADPEGGFPHTLLVELTPERALVTPPGSAELQPMWQQAVEWLVAATPCRVINEFGTDVTQACTAQA